jgi:hypothetical protein
MPTKATKSDWQQLEKELQQTAARVRDFKQGISLGGQQPGAKISQDELLTHAQNAYDGLERCAMEINNLVVAWEGKTPFAGQPIAV